MLTNYLAHVQRLGARGMIDLARATAELALARLSLATKNVDLLVDRRDWDGFTGKSCETSRIAINRVAFAIPRAASRVPWRATCLVQALAAQHWLEAKGIGSTIHLGVKASEAPIDAHAWLKVGERIVLGGDVADYSEFPLHGQR